MSQTATHVLAERETALPLTECSVLVHVGLAKTGTTWLQKHLFSNPKSFYVPAPDHLNAKERTKYLARGLRWDADRRVINDFDFDLEAYRQQCNAYPIPNGIPPVISNEG